MSSDSNFSFSDKIQYRLLQAVGRLLAVTPDFLIQSFCFAIGRLIYFFGGKRKQTLLRNLHHSYPYLTEKERRQIGKRSCQQTVEMGLLGLMSPWVSKDWITSRFSMDEASSKWLSGDPDNPRPQIVMIPHLTPNEAICFVPAFVDLSRRQASAIYRPFDNRAIDAIIKTGRSRWGLRLLSRKEGFNQASAILRQNGIVSILFDQNAGHQGSLTSFLGRIASTTELPALLAKRHGAEIAYLWVNRTGFCRGKIHLDIASVQEMEPGERTIEAQTWLENLLHAPDTDKASWLWMHNRWRTQDEAQYRFQIRGRKIISIPDPKQHPDSAARFWIRMPNWLGDIVMTLPLLRALEQGRPDVHWVLYAPAGTVELLRLFLPSFETRPLPPKGLKRFCYFYRARLEYPDLFLLFTQSTRGDLEARLSRAKDRYGLSFPGKKRRFLTHVFQSPWPRNPRDTHQFQVWLEYLAHFGLKEVPDRTPFLQLFPEERQLAAAHWHFGFICGTENSPEKRWSPECFAKLIESLHQHYPNARFSLYGTAKDREITNRVEEILRQTSPETSVSNIAGQTNMLQFARALAGTTLLIGNDTGGIHLANALGVPTVVLFGPTNPLRTAPVFDTPKVILQPEGTPPYGGRPMSEISPEAALKAVRSLLKDRS